MSQESKVLPPNFDLARILVGTVYSNATSPPATSWLNHQAEKERNISVFMRHMLDTTKV